MEEYNEQWLEARRAARREAARKRRRRMIIRNATLGVLLAVLAAVVIERAVETKTMAREEVDGRALQESMASVSVSVPELPKPVEFEPVEMRLEVVGTGPGPQDNEGPQMPEPGTEEWPEEDPFETQHIEEALIAQGYISDEIPMDRETQLMLRCYCEQYGVPFSLALGIIEAESSFRPEVSNGNCYGYMQINSINAEWLEEQIGVTDLKDPIQNLHSGVFIISDFYQKYGDWSKALVCYNYGEYGARENVFAYGKTSTSYSRAVLGYAEEWAKAIVD